MQLLAVLALVATLADASFDADKTYTMYCNHKINGKYARVRTNYPDPGNRAWVFEKSHGNLALKSASGATEETGCDCRLTATNQDGYKNVYTHCGGDGSAFRSQEFTIKPLNAEMKQFVLTHDLSGRTLRCNVEDMSLTLEDVVHYDRDDDSNSFRFRENTRHAVPPKVTTCHAIDDPDDANVVAPDYCRVDMRPKMGRGGGERYYYDETLDACRVFLFGVWDSTTARRNVFKTKQDCERVCHAGKPNVIGPTGRRGPVEAPVVVDPELLKCHMAGKPEDGKPCGAACMRYYYSPEESSCRIFFNSGEVAGKPNNYSTKFACNNACMNK